MGSTTTIIRRKLRAPVWAYFEPGEDRLSANCLVCNKVISTRSHPTLGLKYHLKTHQRGGDLDKFREGIGGVGNRSEDGDGGEEDMEAEAKPLRNSEHEDEGDGGIGKLEKVTGRNMGGVEGTVIPSGAGFRSPVWKHFIPDSSRRSATCSLCTRVISTRSHPTLGLKSHLRNLHPEEFRELKRQISLQSQDPNQEEEGVVEEGDAPGRPGNQSQVGRVDEPEQDSGADDDCGGQGQANVPEVEDREVKMETINGGKKSAIRRQFRSPVWEYFLPGVTRLSAKCKICMRIVSTRTHPTLGLKSHLRYNHGGHLGALKKEIGLNKDSRPTVWCNRGSSGPKLEKRFRAPAWEFFNPIPFKKLARCRICEKVISTKTHSTLGLKSHLKIHRRGKSLNALRNMIKLPKEDDEDPGSQEIEEEDPEDIEGSAADDEVGGEHELDNAQMDMDEDEIQNDKVDTVTVTRRQLRSRSTGGGSSSSSNHNQLVDDEDVDSCFACSAYISPRLKSASAPQTNPEQYQFLLTEMLELPKEKSLNYLKQLHNPSKWIALCEPCQIMLGEGLSFKKIMSQLQDQLANCQRKFLSKIKAQAEREPSLKQRTKQNQIVEGIRRFVKKKKYSILNQVANGVDESPEGVLTSDEDVASQSEDPDDDEEEVKAHPSRTTLSANAKKAHDGPTTRGHSTRQAPSISRSLSTKSGRIIKVKMNNRKTEKESGTTNSATYKNYRYDCPNCPLVADYTLEMFAQHLTIHQKRPYMCSSCSEFFPADDDLQEEHWQQRHSDDTDHPPELDKFVQIKLDPGQIWKCESCSEGFFTDQERDQHELSCLPPTPDKQKQNATDSSELAHHQCQLCDLGFRNLDEWRLHRAIYHPEVDRLSCYYCDQNFGEEEIRNDRKLMDHVKMEHHGRAIVIYDECEFCGVVWDASRNEKRDHLVEKHGIHVDVV